MKFSLTVSSDDPTEITDALARLTDRGGTSAHAITAATALPPIPTNLGDDDENEPVAAVAPGEVDSSGLPWDERIHAKTKAKIEGGTWRKRRGVADHIVAQVENELRAALAAPATPPAAPVAPPTPPAAPVVPPAAPPVAAAPPPPPVSAAPPAAPTVDFPFLMQEIQKSVSAGKMNEAWIAWLANTLGVTTIPELNNQPVKIVQAWQLMTQHGVNV